MTHPIDTHVGHRIRAERILAGQSQMELGAQIGVQFQQVQKYETGANRVSASKLWLIAASLDRPVAAFFPSDHSGIGRREESVSSEDLRLLGKIKRLNESQKSAILALVGLLPEESTEGILTKMGSPDDRYTIRQSVSAGDG
jgi:transcriptional regulator with XRE-family HTH domain